MQESNPLGRGRYDIVQNEVGLSNVLIVAGQIASATISANPQTVALTGVTAGNTLVIALGARTPTGSAGHFPTLSDSQSQTITSLESVFVIGNAGAYAEVGRIIIALPGTHTITVQTTDILQAGEITIYELQGVASFTGGVASNASASGLNHIALSSPIVQLANQVAIGAAGFEVVAGVGASYVWAGAVQSLSQDGSDANFTGLNGHFSGAISSNDFGATRQGTLLFFGQALAGVVFI